MERLAIVARLEETDYARSLSTYKQNRPLGSRGL
jgi:hypothetical protein